MKRRRAALTGVASNVYTQVRLLRKGATVVEDGHLQRLDARPPLGKYVRGLLDRRSFIMEDARGKTSTQHDELILGRVWNVLNPMLNAAMYGVIFGLLLNTSFGIDNFIGYLVIGLVFFGFVSEGLSSAGTLIRSSKSLINSFSFPIASVVVAQAVRQFFANITPAFVAIVFGLLFQIDEGVSLTVVLVIPLYVLIHIFSCGLMLIIARCTAFVPDLKSLLTIVKRAWFYSSGVFFSFERLSNSSAVHYVLSLNPAYQFLNAVRDVALYGNVPSLAVWMYLCAWTLSIFVFGLIFFWSAEDRYVSAK